MSRKLGLNGKYALAILNVTPSATPEEIEMIIKKSSTKEKKIMSVHYELLTSRLKKRERFEADSSEFSSESDSSSSDSSSQSSSESQSSSKSESSSESDSSESESSSSDFSSESSSSESSSMRKRVPRKRRRI